MGIQSIFNIAQSSLRSQQLGTEVTGENIANVNTPGYSRQRVMLENSETSLASGFPLGNGVKVAQIQRSYDSFLQSQITNGNSTNGQTSTRLNFMQRIEPLFNELTADGLGASLDNFFKSWQDLASNPQGTAQRQAVLAQGEILVDNFHQVNAFLNNTKTDADKSLVGITSDLTANLKDIASLNDQIKEIEVSGGNANELRDKRDVSVQDLAKLTGIRYMEQTDGTLTVTASSGEMLVSGNQSATVFTQVNSTTGLNDIMMTPHGGSTPLNITATIGGPGNTLGSLGGTLNVRDNLVPDKIAKVDELAYNLATTLNTVHSAGYGLNGSTGNDFFTPGGPVTGYSLAIKLNISDINDIAAADTAGAAGNNINASLLAAIQNQNMPTSLGTTTLGSFYNALAGNVGLEVQRAQQSNQQSQDLVNQLNNLRDSSSGVSLDEEMTNLIKYQKAFAGAAKLITTATDMMDTVLGLVR